MVILWVLATHCTPSARSITIIVKDQLNKGHKSGRCISTAMHRTHGKCYKLHTSGVRSLKVDLDKVKAMLEWTEKAFITQK